MSLALLSAASAHAASVATATKGALANTNLIVTAVSFDGLTTTSNLVAATNAALASAKSYTDSAITSSGSVTTEMVSEIASSLDEELFEEANSSFVNYGSNEYGFTIGSILLPPSVIHNTGGSEGDIIIPGSGENIEFASNYIAHTCFNESTAAPFDFIKDNGTYLGAYITNLVGAQSRAIAATSNYAASVAATAAATSSKQDALSPAGTNAINSGITSAKVATYDAYTSYWSGDDFRVTITNYDSQVRIPRLFMEDKLTAGNSNYFRVVWDELARWNAFTGTNWNWSASFDFGAWRTNVNAQIDQKADRAWGYYDSHTGGYSPDGVTQISSASILIAAGMAYQRTITTEGAIWLLESNGLVTQTAGTTNGYFRISDDEGNALFEIVKGDKREVGADCTATSIRTVSGLTYMTAVYPVVSDAHPTMYFSSTITNASWYAETDASCPVTCTWSGSSGHWTNEFHYTSAVVAQSQLFAKAGYQVGGETLIKQSVPVNMQYIVLGNQKYQLGTATISGNTVLTLTAVNQ